MEKKRVRPTVGQVRALEAKVSELEKFIRENTDEALRRKFEEQLDGTSMLVRECDGWRDIYREKCKELDVASKRLTTLTNDISKLREELETEKKLRQKATEDYQTARNEVVRIKGRNLWQRILNR